MYNILKYLRSFIINISSSLPYFDLFIIYIFCIFQLAYNILTLIKIKQSKNKVSLSKLRFSYFFWTYPIIYSIFPSILSFKDSYEFGIFMIYLRIPPIVLTALSILIWTIYIPIHNKSIKTIENISESTFIYNEANFDLIMAGKNIFKKNIIKTNNKFINRANKINNLDDALKVIADAQGWFIAKDKFSWMWLNKKQKTQNFYNQVFENTCYIIKEKISLFDNI